MNSEKRRLAEAQAGAAPWQKWGPYLSERQWGTVREDYSAGGGALSDAGLIYCLGGRRGA